MPKLSIVVPIYNAAQYMNCCIDSILNQTYADFELILVDDGSVDDSPKVCDQYQLLDSRVQTIHKVNGGPTSARKAGALAAKGEYVLCVDSDDYLNLDCLEKCHELIQQYAPDCICFGYQRFSEQTRDNPVYYASPEGLYSGRDLERFTSKILYDDTAPGLNIGSMLFTIWSKVVRREIFTEAQSEIPDNLFFGEDIVLSVKCINKCSSVYISKYVSYNYRVTENSITEKYDLRKFKQIDLVVKQLQQEVKTCNSLSVFCIYTLMGEIYNAAQNLSFDKYCEAMKEIPSACPMVSQLLLKGKVFQMSVKDYVKVLLLQKKMYKLLYLLIKR